MSEKILHAMDNSNQEAAQNRTQKGTAPPAKATQPAKPPQRPPSGAVTTEGPEGSDRPAEQEPQTKEVTLPDGTPVRIAPTLQQYLVPQTKEERDLLESTLIAEGCRDPLVIWKEKNVLLDGHHRLAICLKRHIPFRWVYISLDSWCAARIWILNHQLGRRNLTLQAKMCLGGQLYLELEKHQGERTDLTSRNGDAKSESEQLSERLNSSIRTLQRYGKFVIGLDELAKRTGLPIREAVATEQLKLTDADLKQLLNEEDDGERKRRVAALLKASNTPPTVSSATDALWKKWLKLSAEHQREFLERLQEEGEVRDLICEIFHLEATDVETEEEEGEDDEEIEVEEDEEEEDELNELDEDEGEDDQDEEVDDYEEDEAEVSEEADDTDH